MQHFSIGGRDADRRCTASCRALPYAFSARLAGGSVAEPAWSPAVGLEAFMFTQIFYFDVAPLRGAPPWCQLERPWSCGLGPWQATLQTTCVVPPRGYT